MQSRMITFAKMMVRTSKWLSVSVVCALATLPSSGVEPKERPRVITQCSWGGVTFSLYDSPRSSTVGSYDTLKITGRMLSGDGQGAMFTFWNSGRAIFRKRIVDMYNQNGWLGISNDSRSFALNTSNGGAAGGWSVSILKFENGTVRDLSDSMRSVEKDFSARHFCKARGNNYEAIQWRKNDQLLVSASVYGTSDCGQEMGYTEGYVLEVTTGRIVEHLSEKEMLDLPYVCTYNVWQAGDPQP